MYRSIILLLIITSAISGCKIFAPSVMLKTGKGYNYTPKSDSITAVKQYRISINDRLSLRLYANDGFKLIELSMSGGGVGNNMNAMMRGVEYLVEFDGTVKFPIIGRIYMVGMTVRDAQNMLQEKYAEYYNAPFALLEVTNRRVTIYPGSPGAARVIDLVNENTTLMEALAWAGGISGSGKAYKIKLIRGDPQKPQVYLIDLSTIEGMKDAGIVLQANDIIYVEPMINAAANVLSQITPYIALISSVLVIYNTTVLLTR
jgi:polysaccharide biosynthesis/export protein